MKSPQRPPPFHQLIREFPPQRVIQILDLARKFPAPKDYPHWDKLRHLPSPPELTPREWWLAIKFQRTGTLKPIPLMDRDREPFTFSIPDLIQSELHDIDFGAGKSLGVQEPITNPHTRDHYLIRSLMEEAITSSQLEGAVTTREVAKEMIRTGRPARDTSEQMILNNYITMRHITEMRRQPLSPQLIYQIHKLVTDKTLEDPTAAGRFRTQDEYRIVGDDFGQIFHEPPPADQLPDRLQAMCDFANGKTPDFFIHPVIRGIILHFWLAYDHPFVDGNGRTARALFYWQMLHEQYWLFEFISISSILRKAPVQYGMSFLYSETDDNDLTYFIVAQTRVICRAIKELHSYIDRKSAEVRQAKDQLRALELFNHRQADLLHHSLRHPLHEYTIDGHRLSHNVVYQTARNDLIELADRGCLLPSKRGRKLVFTVPRDLVERLKPIESSMIPSGTPQPRSSPLPTSARTSGSAPDGS